MINCTFFGPRKNDKCPFKFQNRAQMAWGTFCQFKTLQSRVYITATKLACKQYKNAESLARKGKKQVGKIVSRKKGETTTALVCMSASGNNIPPMLIFKKVNMNAQLTKDAPPDSIKRYYQIVGLTQMFWWKSRIVAIFLLFLILLHVLI